MIDFQGSIYLFNASYGKVFGICQPVVHFGLKKMSDGWKTVLEEEASLLPFTVFTQSSQLL